MTEDPTELDPILGRLSEEGSRQRNPEAHPSPEKLSAYVANELSPQEDVAIQEHLTECSVCSELLLELQRFLEASFENRLEEGMADFETTADWRRLRESLRPPEDQGYQFFRSWAVPVAAILAVALIWALFRIVSLERELAEPVTHATPTTIEAWGSRRSVPDTVGPQSFTLGHVAAFQTQSGAYNSYKLIFRDETGRVRKTIVDQEKDGMITVFLPKRFLAPGLYRVQAIGVEGKNTYPICDFEMRISR